MINFAVRRPFMNAESISKVGAQTVGLTGAPDSRLLSFNMSINPRLITVPGRVLQTTRVQYKGRNNKTELLLPDKGSWNMKNIKFMDAKPLQRWGYIRIQYLRDGEYAGNKFGKVPWLKAQMSRFRKVLGDVGISAGELQMQDEISVPFNGWDDPRIEEAFNRASQMNVRYLYIILPDKGTGLYNHLKRLGDRKYGIHTSCSDVANLQKYIDYSTGEPKPGFGEVNYFSNIALKINLKLGGINQLLDTSRLPLIKDDQTMFVGIDVTHPSPGSAIGAPSVAAVVANIDRNMGQWPADLCVQTKQRAEMVMSKLKGMMRSRLDKWITLGKHKTYPENILIYRDGVSEGQYNLVLEYELPQIRAACAEVYSKPDQDKGLPRITIAVVGKRHHTRFYPTATDDGQMDVKSLNCLPGTVVDRGVTEARNWDFYLQAHAALQGTARPAHYQIVLDEIFTGSNPDKPRGTIQAKLEQTGRNQADVFEELTLAMSEVFGRATKVISYATPARYADMVCERARAYLSQYFDPSTPGETPATSVAGGSSEGEALDDDIITLHRSLRDTMFYV